jgi:hypothetical protein
MALAHIPNGGDGEPEMTRGPCVIVAQQPDDGSDTFPLSRTTLDLLVDDWAEAICANGMDLDEVVGDVEQLIGHLRAFEHTVRQTLLPVEQEKRTDDE